jgi:hypothetical protein
MKRRRKDSKCEICILVMLEIMNVCVGLSVLLLNWNDIVEDDCGYHCSSYHDAVLVLEFKPLYTVTQP